jgi:regulator of protease activity HflC (stomatin/prohibitin superfamily)
MRLLESGMLILWPFIAVILIVFLLSFFTVQTAQVAVITRFGKFLRVAQPGLNWKWPFIDRVAGRVSLRVNQITLTMETKTKDNVFVTIPISVQNRVRPEKCTTPSTSSPIRCSRSRPMSSRSFSATSPA